MVLNYECIKDLLSYIESKTTATNTNGTFAINSITLKSVIADKMADYSAEEIFYTLTQMADANLIKIDGILRKGGRISNFNIDDLTPDGHRLLNDIKNPEINSLISKAKECIGQVSMQTFVKAASSVISAAVIAKMKQ